MSGQQAGGQDSAEREDRGDLPGALQVLDEQARHEGHDVEHDRDGQAGDDQVSVPAQLGQGQHQGHRYRGHPDQVQGGEGHVRPALRAEEVGSEQGEQPLPGEGKVMRQRAQAGERGPHRLFLVATGRPDQRHDRPGQPGRDDRGRRQPGVAAAAGPPDARTALRPGTRPRPRSGRRR